VERVAAWLDTSPKQVRNMIARGQICAPVRLPGIGLRFEAEALYRWAQECAARRKDAA